MLIDPLKAVKGDGSSQIESLNSVDEHYCHLISNEEMNLEYRPSLSKDGVNSYFFVSTGYYHNIKRYEGKPQIATLMKFKNKGAFDKFSRQKFEEIQNTLIGVSSK